MHRELGHIGTKLKAPLELKGRTSKKPPMLNQSTMGSWDNLLNRTTDRIKSPQAVSHRFRDNINAGRTINPEKNQEKERLTTRKILSPRSGPEDPGNMLSLFKKSGTVEELARPKKQFVKEKQGTTDWTGRSDIKFPNPKPHEKKREEWTSSIPDLSTMPNTFRDKTEDFSMMESPSKNLGSPAKKFKQEQMKSQIAILPCGAETKREYQDRDEKKLLQSILSPRHIKHLESTYQNQPLSITSSRKDPNKQNLTSYEEDGRLHPFTKGKKVAYPEYKARNISTVLNTEPAREDSSKKKCGNVEPLNALYVGKKNIPEKVSVDNINNPPPYKESARRNTLFSYRTFSSQIF